MSGLRLARAFASRAPGILLPQRTHKPSFLFLLAATTTSAAAILTVSRQWQTKILCDDNEYEPGQAIGEALKRELWKSKHQDVAVMEVEEGSPVLALLSNVRNSAVTGKEFVSYADRLMTLLLEMAYLELPNDEEAVFETPAGVKMHGVLLEEDMSACVVSVIGHGEHPVWEKPLSSVFSFLPKGTVTVKGNAHVDRCDLPNGISADSTVVLVVPTITSAAPIIATLEKLEEAEVDLENIILVAVAISKQSCEKICSSFKGLKIITGAIDPEVTEDGLQLVPGVGDFCSRYKEGAHKGTHGTASTSNRKRFWQR